MILILGVIVLGAAEYGLRRAIYHARRRCWDLFLDDVRSPRIAVTRSQSCEIAVPMGEDPRPLPYQPHIPDPIDQLVNQSLAQGPQLGYR
jgi:hypothetical protein